MEGSAAARRPSMPCSDRLVYGKLRGAFGGRLRFALSGGAPLGERLGHFFDGAGVLDPWRGTGSPRRRGAPPSTPRTTSRVGTVGRPASGRGRRGSPRTARSSSRAGTSSGGYWDNDEATAEVLGDDGWFATGDIGRIDDAGFLRITGRKKDLIVTAGGKNVAPAVLEDLVRSDRIISSVRGGGRRQALHRLPGGRWTWRSSRPSPPSTAWPRAVYAEGRQAVKAGRSRMPSTHANEAVSHAEAIKAFRILPDDFRHRERRADAEHEGPPARRCWTTTPR